jgi:microcystin degradation protein MlrC
VDAYERGEQAASLLLDLVDGRLRPSLAWRRLPLLTVPLAQATDEQPMRGLRARARRWEERGVESAAILPGFPYADVPRAGFTVVANAREPELAEACADDLAGAVWETRAAFHRELVGPEGAVARACAAPSGPVVLADVGDNVGGGAPGDGTVLLEALLDAGADGAVVVLWDPQAAAAAAAAGRGARVELEVGGKAGALQGRPVHVSGSVLRAGNAAYRRTGSYMTGQQVDMGLCAVVATGGIAIVLTTERVMPFDVDHLLAVGVEPGSRKIIVVKSALAWRAAFGAVAAEVVAVDTPGVCAARLETLAYARVPRPIAPLDAM